VQPEQFDAAIARLPRWLLALAALGTAVTGMFYGLTQAGGFLMGALGAWLNLKLVEGAVNRIASTAKLGKPSRTRRLWFFVQFAGLVSGAFVIIKYSGFSMAAAFVGFLVCPAAVVIEIVYELVKYDHS
jgi:hypothetical protein